MAEEKQQSPSDEEEDDTVSDAIGEFGKWQLLLTFLLSLVNIPCTWHIFAPTFHGARMDTWCARPERFHNVAPVLWKNCTEQTEDGCFLLDVFSKDTLSEMDLCRGNTGLKSIKCDAWEFAGPGETIISEFHLVCDRKNLINIAEMMFLAGVAVGGLVCGIISDKYGRKKTLLASIFIQSTLGTVIALAPWFELYVLLRCCLGFISVSVVFSGFILAIELVGGHWRTITGISYLFPVSLGYVLIAGLAWLLPNWRHLQLSLSLPGFLFLGLWFIVPESPRWLLALGRTKEVLQIMETAARFNGKTLPINSGKQLRPRTIGDESAEDVQVSDLFKTPSMRKKTLVLFLIWFSVYLCYYGLVLNLGNIYGNLYVNSVLVGILEVPAIAISIVILLKGGRKWPMAITMILSGVFAALAVPWALVSSDLQWLATAFTMASKFSISSSNAIMPVYTAELYPTIIRNIGVGAANVSAGIALMLVPYLWELISIHSSVPMLVLAVFGIVGGASVLLLPETGCGPLVDTIKGGEEMETKIFHATNDAKKTNNNCCAS
ncbi:organic cation transporter protein-like isoform X2 [Cylas formicarius]|nr:organic cation transporter protein-like isoform X2 [Cylas formicarius]